MNAGLPILMYHAIEPARDVLATDPAWFAETLAALHESGYRTVDLAAWIEQGRPPLEKRFAITFDDGLTSLVTAAEILPRYRFEATAFLVTGRMGRDNAWPGHPAAVPGRALLRWSELPALARAGIRFEAHTVSHMRLDLCNDAVVEFELCASRAAIEQHLGRPCRLLAYPYGIATPSVRRAAARHFRGAFGTRLRFASRADDPHDLARIDAYYLRTERDLHALISGRWPSSLRARRLLRGLRKQLGTGARARTACSACVELKGP